jgi:hypothetical protein
MATAEQFADCISTILEVLGEYEMDPYQAATALAGVVTITAERLIKKGYSDDAENIRRMVIKVVTEGYDLGPTSPSAKPGSPSN